MHRTTTILLALIVLFFTIDSKAQILVSETSDNPTDHEYGICITEDQHDLVEIELAYNRQQLVNRGVLPATYSHRSGGPLTFGWPLRLAEGSMDPGFCSISAFVDHNTGMGLSDYNCGDRTYEGHGGTDMFLWPFWWQKVNTSAVEVIAGADGVILGKADGNPDHNCSPAGSWNAVYLEHADGSVTWYGHMKNGSVTTKAVGQSVTKGEYLGIVASSGLSTGPHLHFEVYDPSGNLVDPYGGPCNLLNGSTSYWDDQDPYYNSVVNAALSHSGPVVYPTCPEEETLNLQNVFNPGNSARFSNYYRDILDGQTATMSLLKPDGSPQITWTYTYSSASFPFRSNFSSNGTVNIPITAPLGTWTYEVTFEGVVTTHEFQVCDPVLGCNCTVPTGMSTTILGSKSVEMSWDQNPNVQMYQAKGRLLGTTDFVGIKTPLNSRVIDNLIPGASYEWKVRAKCLDEQVSDFSAVQPVNMPLKVSVESDNSVFNLYPNITESAFSLDLKANHSGPASIYIYNYNGQLQFSETWKIIEGTNSKRLQLKDFSEGIYLVLVDFEDQRLSGKIMIVTQ